MAKFLALDNDVGGRDGFLHAMNIPVPVVKAILAKHDINISRVSYVLFYKPMGFACSKYPMNTTFLGYSLLIVKVTIFLGKLSRNIIHQPPMNDKYQSYLFDLTQNCYVDNFVK